MNRDTIKKRRVVAYARVSTEHEAQLSALENQVQYYDNIMKEHSEWEFVGMYVDEGITGTSVKKRDDFVRMLNDANEGEFDLIVTREVSRFARNTVDTLMETRKLKKIGVEVYFKEDNIWTMNDEDGELRLTLMATLAQNESKKVSTRVKAGQKISFENGVIYGNGNILGYDKVGKQFVINEEQAETVRMIFNLYKQGNGLRRIQFILEEKGRRTATGLTHWSCSGISRILRNSFYCGIIEYRKEVVLDYLEQKKVKNYDYVDRVIVEGKNYDPIISKELYFEVQEMLDAKTESRQNKGKRGLHTSNDIWCKKLICECGSKFNRKVWHRPSNGEIQYAYQCYNQISTGSISTRQKKGLSIEGICESPMIPQWRLQMMADFIFQNFWNDKTGVIELATSMIEKHLADDSDIDLEETISKLEKEKTNLLKKIDTLIEMRLSGEITKDIFLDKKNKLEERVLKIDEELNSLVEEDDEDYQDKIEVLKYGLEEDFDFSKHQIPDTIIETFVKEIVVKKDSFIWKLCFTDEDVACNIVGSKRKASVSLLETPNKCTRCTGSNQPEIINLK